MSQVYKNTIKLLKENNISYEELNHVPVSTSLEASKTRSLSSPKSGVKAMIVKDNKTGAVLYKKNEYTKRPIASISKLMSALVILEGYVDWEQKATVVPDDLIDSHMYAGDVYTIDELWRAALVASSNKAILTLADSIGWPREAFVERMNQKAMELGMIDTHFEEPTGLNNQNVSTASDLVLLLDEALKLEKIQNTVLMDEVTLYSEQRDTSATLRNTDWLLLNWIPHHLYNIRGGKTGFINASGYNFIMQVEDEKGHIIDVVILGTNVHEARFIEARDIAQAVFDNYEWESEDATK